MAHNINVEAHLKRYQNTELSDIVRLVTALNKLIDERKESHINKLKEQLSLLEQGQIPEEPVKTVPARKTRGGKKVVTDEQEA